MKEIDDIECLPVSQWLDRLHMPDTLVRIPNSYCITRKESFMSRSRHTRHHLLIFLLQGDLHVETAAGNYELQAGNALWLPPHTDRRFWSKGHSKSYRIHCNITDNGRQLTWLDTPKLHKNSWELHPLFERLWRVNRFGDSFKPQQVRAILTLIAIHLSSKSLETTATNRLTLRQCQLVEGFIQHNLNDPISARDIASELQMTRSYVTRLFRNTYNMPPRQFIKEERLNKAAIFLGDSMLQVKQIAHLVGISNMGLFCRQFKEHFGTTPSNYRKAAVRQDIAKSKRR